VVLYSKFCSLNTYPLNFTLTTNFPCSNEIEGSLSVLYFRYSSSITGFFMRIFLDRIEVLKKELTPPSNANESVIALYGAASSAVEDFKKEVIRANLTPVKNELGKEWLEMTHSQYSELATSIGQEKAKKAAARDVHNLNLIGLISDASETCLKKIRTAYHHNHMHPSEVAEQFEKLFFEDHDDYSGEGMFGDIVDSLVSALSKKITANPASKNSVYFFSNKEEADEKKQLQDEIDAARAARGFK